MPVDAAAGLEADLRQLRRLAAARVAADDDDAMLRDRLEHLLARGRDRQLLRILEPIARRPPRGDDLLARRGSQHAGARELDAQLGAAELGAADVERAAIELDGLAHDGEPDALPRHRFVGALAALEQRRGLARP